MDLLVCTKCSVTGAFVRGLMLILMLVAILATANSAETPNESGSVLARFVGTWTTETLIRHAGPPVREITTHGQATCRPSLGGHYFEFRSATIPTGQAELQIMAYDDEAGVYRQWVFSSDGYTHEAVGRWDPTTTTLRWEGKSGESSFAIDDHWASPDRLEWTLRRTNSVGKVLQTIEGTVTRMQEP